MAGAAFWQGRVQISCVAGAAFSNFWHGRIANPIGTDAQGGACKFRGRGSIFARSGTDCVAGAAFSQGQAQISWQGLHSRKCKYIFCGRGSIFARSSADFVANAAISQGEVQISWQAQYFRDRRYDSIFPAAARKSQKLSTKVVFEVHFSSCSLKMGKVKYKSSFRSRYFDEAS